MPKGLQVSARLRRSLFFATEHANDDALGFNNHLFDASHFVVDQRLCEGFAFAATTSELPDDAEGRDANQNEFCLLYTSPSPRDSL